MPLSIIKRPAAWSQVCKSCFLKAQPMQPEHLACGIWHVGGPKVEASDPNDLGVDYYAGNVVGNISDYYYWDLTIQGVTESVTEYHTSKITNLAIDWVATLSCQEAPWCG